MATEILAQIPRSLISSMFVASVAFFVATWLVPVLTTRQLHLKIIAFLAVWYGLVVLLGKTEFFALNPLFLPNIIFAFVLIGLMIKVLYSLPSLKILSETIPPQWLIGLQIFRVMGIGFLSFYNLGLIPGEFAIPTAWGDVFIGATAPFVAFALAKGYGFAKKLAIGWNYLGIADLAMAIFLGIVTFPRPFQFLPTEPTNLPIGLFPLVVVPCFAVPLSAMIHLFTLRELKKQK